MNVRTDERGIARVTGTRAELLDYALPRIRQQSQSFYRREIPADLDRDGWALIDRHAIGVMTVLTEETR